MKFKQRYIWIACIFLVLIFITVHMIRQISKQNQEITSDPCLDKYNECEVQCYYSVKKHDDNYAHCLKICTKTFLECPGP